MIPNNFSMINTDEDFIKYFIYFYEYTFTILDEQDFEIEEELKKIILKQNFNNYESLWIYCYLQITLKIIEKFPLELLKDSVQKIAKDFSLTDKDILDMQFDLLDDTLQTLGIISLEIRPYEQLYRNSTFGKFILNKEKEITSIFEEMKEKFSDTAINRMCYVKLKDRKYANKTKILFEFYITNLFQLVTEAKQNKNFNLDNDIETSIIDFVKCFKKGRLNKEIVKYLTDISKGLIVEYISLDYKDEYLFGKK